MIAAFYKAKFGNWEDSIISTITNGPYSHCELVFSDGIAFSSSPRDGGVRFKPGIDFNSGHWDLVKLEVDKIQEMIMYNWAETQIGKPYDWLGVISFVLPFIRNNKDTRNHKKWFCSEIDIAALQQVGILRYHKAVKFSPNTFFTLIYNH